MLPVYKAQSFIKVMDGGSTKPWLVIVNVKESLIPYVVKLYSEKHVTETYSVLKMYLVTF
jgi:hypothetical protein